MNIDEKTAITTKIQLNHEARQIETIIYRMGIDH